MKTTFEKLYALDQFVGALYKMKPEIASTKFGVAYGKHSEKNYQPLLKKRGEKLEEIYIDNALEDEVTKAILYDKENPRGYKSSKEGMKKVIGDERAFLETFSAKEVDVEQIICSDIPEELKEVEQVKEVLEVIFKLA